MSAILQFLAADGSTVVTTVSLGDVPTPGQPVPQKLYLNNTGDQTAQNATVALEQIGTNDGFSYSQLSLDNSGVPLGFSNAPLSLGNVAASGKTAFWTKVVLISGLTSGANPRRYTLLATAQTV